jgi:hypothetical protein
MAANLRENDVKLVASRPRIERDHELAELFRSDATTTKQ